MINANNDFYQKLRRNIKTWLSKEGKEHRWAEYILLAPDLFHLILKLSTDKDVPPAEKVKLVAVITYFVSPLDFIPEAILGPIAFADDIVLVAFVLNSLLNKVDPEVVKRHWAGEEDILQLVQKIILAADKMVGSGIVKKLKKKL